MKTWWTGTRATRWLRRAPSPPWAYALAVLLGGLAVLACHWFGGISGSRPTFLLVFPAVVFAAWVGGFGPGLLSMVVATVGTLASNYLDPLSINAPVPQARLLLAIFSALLICVMAEQLHRARRRAQQNAAAAAELLVAEQHLNASLLSAPISLSDMDLSLRYTKIINPASGFAEADLIGKLAEDVMEPETAAKVTALRQEVIASGQRRCTELALDIAGKRRMFDIVVMPLRDALGRISGITNVAIDITDRIAERHAARALEERFRAAKESALDAFMVLRVLRDPQDRIIDFVWDYINPAGAQMMRLQRSEIVGQRLLSAFPGQRDHPELFPSYVVVAETGVARRAELFYDRDGFNHWFKIAVVQVKNGVAVTFSDVTQERLATARSEEALAAAQAADHAKDEFLANLSHELRTPLNAMLGWARLLEANPQGSDTAKRAAEIIARNATHQAQLISDLMDMNQVLSGRIELKLQRLDAAELLDHAIEAVAPQATKKAVLVVNAVERNTMLDGDPERLLQAFLNLLANAVKFTPGGGQVSVRSERQEDTLAITVADSGEGISAEFLPRVFERFTQADSSATRRHGGLGIGLSIVKTIVELHGGHVSAESEGTGRGARFVVTLPLGVRREDDTANPAVSAGTLQLGNMRILVVDDEADARDVVREILSLHGATAATAGDASSAIDMWGTGNFDVLVSDISMPDMDGYELLRRLCQSPSWRKPAVALALTAFSSEAEQRRAVEAGFDLMLTKPIEPSALVNALSVLSVARQQGVDHPDVHETLPDTA